MKSIAIKVNEPLPPSLLSEAEQEPVLLTVEGRPRYVIRSVAGIAAQPSEAELAASEDEDWRSMSMRNLLNAYGEEDAIYDEL